MPNRMFSSASVTLEQVAKHFEQVKVSANNCYLLESLIVLVEANNTEFIVRNEQHRLFPLSIF